MIEKRANHTKEKNVIRIMCFTLIALLVFSTPTFLGNDGDVYGASKKVKVTYKANGGVFTAKKYSGKKSYSKKKKKGKKHGALPKIKREGYQFDGWYTKKSGGKKVTKNTKIKKKTTFYAQWTKIENPKDLPIVSGFKIRLGGPVYHSTMYVHLYSTSVAKGGIDIDSVSEFRCYYRPQNDPTFKSKTFAKEKGVFHSDYLTGLDPTITYELYATAVNKEGAEFARTEMQTFKIGNNLTTPKITGMWSCDCCTSFDPKFTLYRDVTHYEIYASESIDGKYKLAKLYTLEYQHYQMDPFFGVPDDWKGNFVKYYVGVVKPGKTYYIKMRAVFESKKTGKKAYSVFSNTYKLVPNFKSFPATKGVKVTNKTKNSAKISWKDYKGPDPYGYHYKIYLKRGKKGKYKKIKTIKRYSYVNSYTMKKLKKNTKYTVYMVALNSHGDTSKKSKKITFKTK